MTLMELEARLSLNTTDFATGVQGARDTMAGMQVEMTQLQTDATNTGTVMQSAFGHALGDLLSGITEEVIEAAFAFAEGSIELASSMEEVQNVVDVTFGAGADQINAWAKTTAQAYGVGELAALKYAGTMGATLTGMGVGQSEIYGMSTALVQLAGDMASFYNLDTATAFQKIMSGMTGEMEPLKQLGIVMSAANLEAHALSMGIETAWTKMDAATQTQVRYNYLMQQTAAAQGDFTSTSGSYANQMRILEENIASLQLTLGEKLLPVMTDVVTFFNSLFGGAESGAEAITNVGQTLGETYATIDTTTANALALVDALARMEAAGVDTAEEQSVWNALLSDLSATLPEISSLIDQSTGSINGGTAALESYVQQWQETQREIAIASALQQAQSDVMAQATEVARLQMQLQVTQMTESDAAAREEQIWAMARDYLGYSQEDALAHVGLELADRAEEGDAYANYLTGQLEALFAREEDQAALESQLLAAEAMLADMNAQYAALEASVQAMQRRDGEGTTEDSGAISTVATVLQETNAALATLKTDVAEAAREGVAAGVGQITVTGTISTGQVTLNTGAVVGALTPVLNLKLGTLQRVAGR